MKGLVMGMHLRLIVGVALVMAIFLFFVIQARSQEALDTATSTEATKSATTTEAEVGPAIETTQVNDIATSTEATETAISTEDNPTNDIIETPVVQEVAALTGTSTLEVIDSQAAASSSPIGLPLHKEREFILQPSASLMIEGTSTVHAQISIHNLSCRACSKSLGDTEVIAYYTPWYPNDGEAKETGSRIGEVSYRVSGLDNWGEQKIDWSSEVPSGRYYFVVVADPNNQNNLYSMHRLEFEIVMP